MSMPIALRLPDSMVEWLNSQVANGRAPNRTAIVSAALEREMRRQSAARDVEILSQTGPGDDLDELVAFAADLTSDVDE